MWVYSTGLCSHVIELCLLSQPMLTHKIAWNLLLELRGNCSHTIRLHRQHNSLAPIEQKTAYVYVRACLCFQCLWDTRIITSFHPYKQILIHSHRWMCVCVRTHKQFSAPVKCFHWNSHIAPQGQVAAITFSYIWSRNLCLLSSVQSVARAIELLWMDALVGTGAEEGRRGGRKGLERRRAERERKKKDSREVDDGSLGCSKAMSKNSSHQTAC